MIAINIAKTKSTVYLIDEIDGIDDLDLLFTGATFLAMLLEFTLPDFKRLLIKSVLFFIT
jgi:hypothetical protein